MEDFNSYSKKQQNYSQNSNNTNSNASYNNSNSNYNQKQNLLNLVSSLAKQYDGKSKNELFRAIYEQAKIGKANGTLTNAEIDNFANMLLPFLDDKMKKALNKVITEIKKI